jgi:hypothetical protein
LLGTADPEEAELEAKDHRARRWTRRCAVPRSLKSPSTDDGGSQLSLSLSVSLFLSLSKDQRVLCWGWEAADKTNPKKRSKPSGVQSRVEHEEKVGHNIN